jgi:RNA polymerase sigma-70 factor (ECF subfamily)
MTLFVRRPELLAGFRRGERAVLAEVYWTYVDDVERLLRRGFSLAHKGLRVDGAAPSELADLVQEVFVRAFGERSRQGYDGQRPFGPYLATIARNLLCDRGRQRGRDPLGTLTPDELARLLDSEAACVAAAEEPAWASPAAVAAVEAYLTTLPEELRAIHEQRYVQGLSQELAAQALGITRQTLRTRETRLREGLVAYLAAAGLEP